MVRWGSPALSVRVLGLVQLVHPGYSLFVPGYIRCIALHKFRISAKARYFVFRLFRRQTVARRALTLDNSIIGSQLGNLREEIYQGWIACESGLVEFLPQLALVESLKGVLG